jgi:hypothetical protein
VILKKSPIFIISLIVFTSTARKMEKNAIAHQSNIFEIQKPGRGSYLDPELFMFYKKYNSSPF